MIKQMARGTNFETVEEKVVSFSLGSLNFDENIYLTDLQSRGLN